MRPFKPLDRILLFGVLLPSVFLTTILPAEGQELDGVRFGAGFVVNAPSQMAGGGGWVVFPFLGGIGLYVDAKGDLDSPAQDRAFDETITANDVVSNPRYAGAHYLKRETSWRRSYNAAVVRPVSQFLMVYGGAGFSQGERYALYDVFDGDFGRALWVRDPDGDEDRVNLMLGLILRMNSRVSSQFGIETQPRGFTAGLALRLPRW